MDYEEPTTEFELPHRGPLTLGSASIIILILLTAIHLISFV